MALVVAALTFVAFLPALKNGFVDWDDYMNLLYNPDFRGLGWERLRWMFTTRFTGLYQPLAWLSLSLDFLVWGLRPIGYHLTNLILHAINAILFYFLCARLLMAARPEHRERVPFAAAVAALLFSIHPLRAESVVWVSERRDVLSGTLYLSALWFYLRHVESETSITPAAGVLSRYRWYAASLASFVLALFSKATVATLPLTLAILDVYPLRRLPTSIRRWTEFRYRRLWLEKIPYLWLAAMVAEIGAIAPFDIGDAAAMGIIRRISVSIAAEFYGAIFYLWKFLLPIRLSPVYQLPTSFDLWSWPFVGSGLAVVAASLALWKLRRRWPAGLAAWIHYLGALIPPSVTITFGNHTVADRYTYIPCLAWPILVAGALRTRRRGWEAAASIVVLAFVVLTWKQSLIWRDSLPLWKHATELDPAGIVAQIDLRSALAHDGRPDATLLRLADSVARRPDDPKARCELLVALRQDMRTNEALEQVRQACRLMGVRGIPEQLEACCPTGP